MDPVHLAWAARHYAIGMRRTPSGVLRLGERCVDATSGTPVMVDCAAAPAWTLDARGALRSAAGCLRAELGGSVVVTPCGLGAVPGDRFWLDDEGHLWSGMVPAAVEVGPLSHVSCLRVDQDRLRTHACGGGDAPVWEIAGTMTLPDGGADQVARWVADLDGDHQPDWCAASPAGPMCSLASDSSVTITPSAWGYALGGRVQDSAGDDSLPEPDAAMMTDIDGDGRADLCSVHDGKVACARSLGHGFGPRAVVARLPAGMTASALWAEPAQLCAGDGATTACIGKP